MTDYTGAASPKSRSLSATGGSVVAGTVEPDESWTAPRVVTPRRRHRSYSGVAADLGFDSQMSGKPSKSRGRGFEALQAQRRSKAPPSAGNSSSDDSVDYETQARRPQLFRSVAAEESHQITLPQSDAIRSLQFDYHGHGQAPQTHTVAMVCDFFYPRLGGVENHLYQLSQCLIERGHKVIIITHLYGRRTGVRYMTDGLKVYYTPFTPFVDMVTFPTFYSFFPLFRDICIREGVTIVHGHQATSMLAHEALMHAATMGLRTVYTDHSLFGFADAASIHINKLCKFTLSNVDQVITVSHTGRENTTLRAKLDPRNVAVIPNAVDPTSFVPNPQARDPNTITIVVLSRLVYRKGVDLVVDVIPEICNRHPLVNFIIGGDGPERIKLEEMRDKYQLHDRVEMLGAIAHADVRSVLCRGHIFLNCSLTEAFCIAILEAASCGLMVVSTRVGGIPEVLPSHMIKLCDPTSANLVDKLSEVMPLVHKVQPYEFHEQVKEMYSWRNVAQRTEIVYDRISALPGRPLLRRLERYHECGKFAGILFACLSAMDYLVLVFLEWLRPESGIERARTFPRLRRNQVISM